MNKSVDVKKTQAVGFFKCHPFNIFKPCAFYDKHMDCIRVIIRDCSVTEHRVSKVLTILEDNYPERGQSIHVGFTIKGVRHLFNEMNLQLEGVLKVTDLLHEIVSLYPEEMVRMVIDNFDPLLRDTELEIDFSEAA